MSNLVLHRFDNSFNLRIDSTDYAEIQVKRDIRYKKRKKKQLRITFNHKNILNIYLYLK